MTLPYSFSAGTKAKAAEVNANFTYLLNKAVTDKQSLDNSISSLNSSVSGISSALNNVASAGIIVLVAVNSVPSGYLLCNGGAVSRTSYSTLFAKIGTTWGSGDGSTTFNLPNLIGRILKSDYVNQWDTTYWTSAVNLSHSHTMGGFQAGNSAWNTQGALGDHNHSLTISTTTLLPCIKY